MNPSIVKPKTNRILRAAYDALPVVVSLAAVLAICLITRELAQPVLMAAGTTNTVSKFTSGSTVGNSSVTDDGTTFAINTNKVTVTEASGNTVIAGTGSFGGALDMTNHLISNVTSPVSASDVATKSYVDSATGGAVTGTGTANTTTKWTGTSALGNAWPTDDGTTWGVTSKFTITEASGNFRTFGTGTVDGAFTGSSTGSFGGALNMNSHLINNVTDPSGAQDAATKNYVDTHTTSAVNTLTNTTFGDGLDGSQTFDGSTTILGLVPSANTYTMTRDLFLTSSTVNTGVTIVTAGYRVFATGTLTLSGTANINNNGTAGGNSTAGTGGAGGTTRAFAAGLDGGAGANGAGTGTQGGNSPAGLPRYFVTVAATAIGAAGGSLGQGGGGGDSSSNTTGKGGAITVSPTSTASTYVNLMTGLVLTVATPSQWSPGSGGGGGGSNGSTGKGGGGGGAGGVCFVAARVLAGTGTITAKGGNGGNGLAGNSSHTGGGGGGGGGLVILTYNTLSGVTTSVSGGTKGTPTGTGDTAGDGAAGAVIKYNLSGDGT